MTSLPTIQKLSKLGKILSNIAFIFSIVGCIGCLLGMIALQTGAGSVLKLGGVTMLYESYDFQKLCTFPGFFQIGGKPIDFDLMNLDL